MWLKRLKKKQKSEVRNDENIKTLIIKKTKKPISSILLLVFGLVFGFSINYFIGFDQNNQKNHQKGQSVFQNNLIIEDKKESYPLFSAAWDEIQRNFIHINDINIKKIDLAITKKMIENLNCQFSRLNITPYPQAFIREIGIGIEKRNEEIIVTLVEKEGPVYKKININDRLINIDNKDIRGLTFLEIAKKLKGKHNTRIILTFFIDDIQKTKKIEIIRREIVDLPPLPQAPTHIPPTVEWRLKNNNIAYIQIQRFKDGLYFDFKIIIDEILASPAQKIILDLRDNSGGELGIVKRISENFMKKGQIILIEKKIGTEVKHKSTTTGDLSDLEVVVLVNKNSASGSEILAAALKENRDAILVGEKTFGKASVQKIFHLKDNYNLVLTTNIWLTPKGNYINKNGIIPDYEILDSNEQLEKAIRLSK